MFVSRYRGLVSFSVWAGLHACVSIALCGVALAESLRPSPTDPITDSARDCKAEAPADSDCAGQWYRAKKDDVPVYDSAETVGEVVYKLSLGQRVCYYGEQHGFAIIESPLCTPANSQKDHIAYVRLVDLWEPRGAAEKRRATQSPAERVVSTFRGYYHYFYGGGVPDDAFSPYRATAEEVRKSLPRSEVGSGKPSCPAPEQAKSGVSNPSTTNKE